MPYFFLTSAETGWLCFTGLLSVGSALRSLGWGVGWVGRGNDGCMGIMQENSRPELPTTNLTCPLFNIKMSTHLLTFIYLSYLVVCNWASKEVLSGKLPLFTLFPPLQSKCIFPHILKSVTTFPIVLLLPKMLKKKSAVTIAVDANDCFIFKNHFSGILERVND